MSNFRRFNGDFPFFISFEGEARIQCLSAMQKTQGCITVLTVDPSRKLRFVIDCESDRYLPATGRMLVRG